MEKEEDCIKAGRDFTPMVSCLYKKCLKSILDGGMSVLVTRGSTHFTNELSLTGDQQQITSLLCCSSFLPQSIFKQGYLLQ